jgi:DNA-binding HxlR family transcriptional regulator
LGVRRFDDFQARLGISRNILNQRLKRLVDSGVLERVPYQANPPRSEYRLNIGRIFLKSSTIAAPLAGPP